MTSFRQFEANRRNAERSTGPKTEEGKRRSRRNALRHGLCAETVIEIVEDVEDYKEFESAVIANYEAETAVERELALRLASLLWRIRRATSIDTDLMRLQVEILRKHRLSNGSGHSSKPHYRVLQGGHQAEKANDTGDREINDSPSLGDQADGDCRSMPLPDGCRDLTHSFQRLTNLDNGAFDRLGRYESALWRQVAQLLFVLQSLRRR
jgi:hypothetical protein